ncbi:MAG: hypothetical protein H6Q74_2073 [Firmicutes bacterium]|nr:hypothetical protein [Bacillota bacterium]
MNFTEQVSVLIMGNLQSIILVITVLILLALIVFININIKLSRLNKKYSAMMRGTDGGNLESLLMKQSTQIAQAVDQVSKMDIECKKLSAISKNCVQKVGLVRFNAFEDVGSDLSFALAILDGQNNGLVISSIYGRSESRIYAKPVENGQSSYHLTDEEKAALNKAQEKTIS